jgi:membrane-associated phospholipid phosphatase
VNVPAAGPTRVRDRIVVAIAVGAFAALAILVWHTPQPLAWERPIISALGHLPFPTRSWWIAMFDPVTYALITLALAFAAAVAAEVVLKPLVGRVRTREVGHVLHLVHFGGNMFPSAHVTAAAAFATFAFLVARSRSRLAGALFAIPVVVGAAVVSERMHDPADVLGGLILGPLVVLWVVAVVRTAGRHLGLERFEEGEPERRPADRPVDARG